MIGEAKPRDCEEFKQDQKNPAYRKAVKKWLQRGIPLYSARYVAREEARKPSTSNND